MTNMAFQAVASATETSGGIPETYAKGLSEPPGLLSVGRLNLSVVV